MTLGPALVVKVLLLEATHQRFEPCDSLFHPPPPRGSPKIYPMMYRYVTKRKKLGKKVLYKYTWIISTFVVNIGFSTNLMH